jgi:predicted nucleotidyltransferase
MSINSYASNLASSLVLSNNEKSNISTSLNTIKSRLSTYFSDVTEKIEFGSYIRETILPRKVDSNSDIDLMVIFSNPNEYQPQSFLNRLKDFAEKYYSQSEIYQSSPTIVLELNHIKFELVPTYLKLGVFYYIPKNSSEWQYTNPSGFYGDLQECNKNNGYKIKPVIRLMKYWNIQKNYRDMASFELEKKIAENMKFEYLRSTNHIDYIKKAFELIKYTTNYNRVDTALNYIKNAINYETNNKEYEALTEIKKVFPEV